MELLPNSIPQIEVIISIMIISCDYLAHNIFLNRRLKNMTITIDTDKIKKSIRDGDDYSTRTLTTDKKLPARFSDGINLAIDDLIKTEKDPRYEIDMGEWYVKRFDVCEVCLAGSVMAQTLELTLDLEIPDDITRHDPEDFKDEVLEDKLTAFDSIRCGEVEAALDYWYRYDDGVDVDAIDRELLIETLTAQNLSVDAEYGFFVNMVDYNEDPAEFKRMLRDIAKALAEVGL